jgi:hypothetical protein
MADGFFQQLKSRVGKVVVITFSKDHQHGGQLLQVADDHIVLAVGESGTIVIPIEKITYFRDVQEQK